MGSKLVIGYYDKTFTKKFFEFHKSHFSEFINAKMELKGGVCVDSKTIVETSSDDLYFEMLKNNKMTIIAYNEVDEIMEVHFTTPIPYEVFNSYYSEKDPIYN